MKPRALHGLRAPSDHEVMPRSSRATLVDDGRTELVLVPGELDLWGELDESRILCGLQRLHVEAHPQKVEDQMCRRDHDLRLFMGRPLVVALRASPLPWCNYLHCEELVQKHLDVLVLDMHERKLEVGK